MANFGWVASAYADFNSVNKILNELHATRKGISNDNFLAKMKIGLLSNAIYIATDSYPVEDRLKILKMTIKSNPAEYLSESQLLRYYNALIEFCYVNHKFKLGQRLLDKAILSASRQNNLLPVDVWRLIALTASYAARDGNHQLYEGIKVNFLCVQQVPDNFLHYLYILKNLIYYYQLYFPEH